MKKFIVFLMVILGIAGVAVITCPDKQAHKDAIMNVINEKINESLGTTSEEADGFALFASSLGSGIASYLIENRLVYKNHFVYSTSEITKLDGETSRLSVGVFGHVFTFKKEDLDKVLEDTTD